MPHSNQPESARAVLRSGAAEFGLALTAAQLDQYDRYLDELEKWNRRINLTGSRSRDELITRHILDSLAGVLALRELGAGERVADLGSGAGFPGIPLKIAMPSLDLTLIEPRQKRAAFLLHISGTLGLAGVTVMDRAADSREAARFDWILMRAVADPTAAGVLAAPLLRPQGRMVLWLSEQQAESMGGAGEVLRYCIGSSYRSTLVVVARPS